MKEYMEDCRIRIETERKGPHRIALDFVVSRTSSTTGYRDLTPKQARRLAALLQVAAFEVDGEWQ